MKITWLEMRINEEKERRARDREIQARLPRAVDELYQILTECIAEYTRAFGPNTAEISIENGSIRIVADNSAQVRVTTAPALPGFQVVSGPETFQIEIGTLPGDKLYYKYQEQYLTMEQLTRRILDRPLFPKLGE